jgi:hypothetical protein
MSKDTLTFDNRAAAVKRTLAQYQGMPVAAVAEGFISAEQIRANILTDMRSFVKQMEMLRAGSKDRKSVDVSLAQFAKRKYGFSFDEATGSPESFYEAIGVDPSMHTLESLYSMPDFDEGYRWLIPEVIREAVRLGLRKSPIYPNLIAAEENVSQPKVQMPSINMSDAMPKKIGEAESIPVGVTSFNSKDVKLSKFATGVEVTDEVQQYVSLNLLSLYLQDAGVKLGIALDSTAIDVLINGDQADASGAAAVIGAITANTITYRDLLRAWIRLGGLGKTPSCMLSHEEAALDILDLSEFKGFAGQTKSAIINLQTPVPQSQSYYIHGAFPTGKKVMLVDKTSALIKLNAGGLRVESDRIVQKQISGTYVTLTTGFANLFRDARLLINYGIAYAGNEFPSWMDMRSIEAETFKG